MKKHIFKRGKEKEMNCSCYKGNGACGGGIYFLGIIASAIYYIQQSSTFWEGVLGVLKALVWPVFLIYKLFSQ